MMSKSGWVAIAVTGIVILLIVLAGIFLLGRFGMGGFRGMGPGMMGGWGFGLFEVMVMLFILLIPLGFLALIVLGVILLARSLGTGRTVVAAGRACPNCGYNVQSGWNNCPNCGRSLAPVNSA